jgi:DNA invertase Pin-like site-specific DNA recombinase
MNCAIYARVSTLDQTCEMQLTELRQYAAGRQWIVSAEFVDLGISGKTRERPQLKACIAAAMRRQFDAILVYKLDRWGRTVNQLSTDILALDSAGVRFICPNQGIDTDKSNSMSRLLMNILSSFAEFERDVIEERVRSGVSQYRNDYAAGKIGVTRHSRSGKDLPQGRPKRVFDRQAIADMRDADRSWSEIAAITGLPKSTCRDALIGKAESA